MKFVTPLLVVISFYVILCFTDRGFGFIDYRPHSLRELVDCL